MLPFCGKTIVKESSNFGLAHLKMTMKERKTFWLPGNFLVRCFFTPLAELLVMKTLEGLQYIVIRLISLVFL